MQFRAAPLLLLLAAFLAPRPAAADLLVSDIQRDVIKRFREPNGAYAGEFVTLRSGGLRGPQGMAFGPDGNLYVASSGPDSVLRYDGLTGEPLGAFVRGGPGASALTFGPDGFLYITCHGTNEVRRFDARTGRFGGVFVPPGANAPQGPTGLTFGPGGNLFVASFRDSAVYCYQGGTGVLLGRFVPSGSGNLRKPIGLTFGPDGNLYVASSDGGGVLRYNGQTGEFLDEFVAPATEGLAAPQGVLFGPDGNLYVSNFGTKGVMKFSGRSGAFLENFTTGGGLYSPHLMAFTPVCGKLRLKERFDFGRLTVGASQPVEVMLENTSGTEELRLRALTVDGPFALSGDTDAITIPPGGHVTVTVIFRPVQFGRVAGKLTFKSSDQPSGIVSVPLDGEGG